MTEGPLRPFCPCWRQDPPGSLQGLVLRGMHWEAEQAVNPVPRMPGHLFPSLGGRGGVDPSSALSHIPSLQSTRHRKKEPGSHLRGARRQEAETGRESDLTGRQGTLPRGLCTWTRERCRPLLVTTGKGTAIHRVQDRVSGRRNFVLVLGRHLLVASNVTPPGTLF